MTFSRLLISPSMVEMSSSRFWISDCSSPVSLRLSLSAWSTTARMPSMWLLRSS
jgi:hypothetical protein